MSEAKWQATLSEIAWAEQAVAVVGVRPQGTWFAHCNGTEVDALSPAAAVRDLSAKVLRHHLDEMAKGDAKRKRDEAVVSQLGPAKPAKDS